MLTFAYRWLLALIVLPPILRRLLPAYRQTQTGVVVPFLDRLAALTRQQPASGAVVLRPPLIQRVSLWLVWLCLVLALARPQWLEKPIIKTLPTRDLLLAVDLSGSMETQDFADAAGQRVDRLTAVKVVLDEETLKAVAATTGGGYSHANDWAALADIYAQLDALRTRELQTVSHRPKRELFPWPLGVGLLLSLAYHLVWGVHTSLRRKHASPVPAAAPLGSELSPAIMPMEGDAAAEALSLAEQQLSKAGLRGSILLITTGVPPEQGPQLTAHRERGGAPVQILDSAARDDAGPIL
jgi:hypothetical protein